MEFVCIFRHALAVVTDLLGIVMPEAVRKGIADISLFRLANLAALLSVLRSRTPASHPFHTPIAVIVAVFIAAFFDDLLIPEALQHFTIVGLNLLCFRRTDVHSFVGIIGALVSANYVAASQHGFLFFLGGFPALKAERYAFGEFTFGFLEFGCAERLEGLTAVDDRPFLQPALFRTGVEPDAIGDADPHGILRGFSARRRFGFLFDVRSG